MSQVGSMDQLKNQILTISALKNDGNIFTIIQSFLVVCLIEQLFMFIPVIKGFVERYLNHWFDNAKKNIVINSNIPITLTKQSSIVFSRNFKQNIPENELTDAIIEYISGLNNSKFVKYNKFFYVCHNDVIELDSKVNAVVRKTVFTSDGDIEHTELEIFSYYYDLSDLHKYVNKILETSRAKRHNKLGEKIYYFNEVSVPLGLKTDGTFNYANSRQALSFTLTEFNTSKTLTNIYGEGMEVVRKRIDFFNNNRDWYISKGVPYTFGLLMHGEPGCGKTSLIKAIANVTKRHIINISLNKFTTKTQLKNLFFSDKITIDKPGGMTENLIIPIEKRLYVIEDIDCATDIVLDRNYIETGTPNQIKKDTPRTTVLDRLLKQEEDYDNIKKQMTDNRSALEVINLFDDFYNLAFIQRKITLDNFNEKHSVSHTRYVPDKEPEKVEVFICLQDALNTLLRCYDNLNVTLHVRTIDTLIGLLCQIYSNTKMRENSGDRVSGVLSMEKIYSNATFIGDPEDEKFMTANEAYGEIPKKQFDNDDNYCTLKNTQSSTDMLLIKDDSKLSQMNLLHYLGYFPLTALMRSFIKMAVTDYNALTYFGLSSIGTALDNVNIIECLMQLRSLCVEAAYESKFKTYEECEKYIETRDKKYYGLLKKAFNTRCDMLINENIAGNVLSQQFSEYKSAKNLIDSFIHNKKKIDNLIKKPQDNKPETTLLSQPIKDNPFNFPKLDIPKPTKDVPVNQIVDPSGMGGMFNDVNQKKEEAKKLIDNISSEEINLSFLLNILDGVLETPGRILIMSSNYPERLDKALIRPGRIDLMIEFTKCSDKTIKEMLSAFFDIKPVVLTFYKFPEYQYTPAEVNQIMFQNIHSCDDAIRILLEKKL